MKLKPVIRNISGEEILEQEVREYLSVNNDFGNLCDSAYLLDRECKDYLIKEANIHNVEVSDGLSLCFRNMEYPLTRYSMSQLSTKLGVPMRYIDRCIRDNRKDIVNMNFNSWLFNYNKDLFVRTHKGRVRGVLSSKYSVCDTSEILDVIGSTLDLSEMRVTGSFMSPERFHMRMAMTDKLPVEGEDLFAGFAVDSSDVGRSVLRVQFMVYKQICTNGLMVSIDNSNLFSQKHIGITADDFKKGLKDGFSGFTIVAEETVKLIENSRKVKLPPALYDIDTIRGLSEEERSATFKDLKTSANISEQGVSKVIELLSNEVYEPNQWGLINALTEVAQDYTLERRLDIEKYAGTLLVA